MRNKALSLTVCVLLVFSLVLGVTGSSLTAQAQVKGENDTIAYSKGPFDLSIARMDKIAEMLKKNGKIAKNATQKEIDKAVKAFLKGKMANMPKEAGKLDKEKSIVDKAVKDKIDELSSPSASISSVVNESYTGTVMTDKVLAVLMEFPDYNHNSILPSETDLYYSDYTPSHFEDMLFGDSGYAGPSGQSLISMKQYYKQQSGDSYIAEGQVSGWYMANYSSDYYGANDQATDNDVNPRALVLEAMAKLAQDPNINLADYDVADVYDLDGDGNYREPDGIIDHLMIFHAGVGEEAGGGALGVDAIWSHSWSLADVTTIPGTSYSVYDYTMQPEDGAAGVCAHEYGHDLGLPDEYDTQYTGDGEPVSFWSIMSSGSWAGLLAGTEPTGFSPYAKEYFQARYGGNWLTGSVVDFNTELDGTYKTYQIDQASSKGTNNDYIRVNLPKKSTPINTPYEGQYEYYSTMGDNLDTAMTIYDVSVSGRRPSLTFNAWYQIENGWDYAYVQVRESGTTNWTNISGNITTTTNPSGMNLGNGITGSTNGWTSASFSVSAYSGKNIDIRFRYVTDGYVSEPGLFVDNIKLLDRKTVLMEDNADSSQLAVMEGFELSDGSKTSNQYYLIEWRNHSGVDTALSHIMRGTAVMNYEPGLLVWHVDEAYTDNWVGQHPGYGYLGVVDADQNVLNWSNGNVAGTSYQIHDATFKMTPSSPMYLDLTNTSIGATLTDNTVTAVPVFDDANSYQNAAIPDAGKLLETYGIKIRVIDQAADMSTATIEIGTMLP